MSENTVVSVKTKFLILSANGLAALMDFGVGAFIAVLMAPFFGSEPTLFHLLFGGVLALLPDFDIVPTIFQGKSVAFDHHQTPLHRPLLMLTLVPATVFFFGGVLYASIAYTCLLWHFLHDTQWTRTYESGIAWLWPFSGAYWSIYGPHAPVYTTDHHEWLRRYWLIPSRRSVSEISTGTLCLALAALTLSGSLALSSMVVYALLTVTFLIWFSYRRS